MPSRLLPRRVRGVLPLLLALPFLAACDGPTASGRRGNAFFDLQQYGPAREAYHEGLARVDTLPSRLRASFFNNTGLAHLAEGRSADALAVLDSAAGASPSARLLNDSRYNAGVAAHQASRQEVALERFRQALLARESDDDARYNWEVVRRQLQKDEQQKSGGEPPPVPSDFARQLKARAEQLAADHRYRDAHTLMQQGLEKDETVAAFGDFIQRLGAVADIHELAPPASR